MSARPAHSNPCELHLSITTWYVPNHANHGDTDVVTSIDHPSTAPVLSHELPDNLRIGEGNDKFGLTRFPVPQWWNAERIAQAIEMHGGAINLGDEETGLMDMKVVVLGIFVEYSPLFRVAQVHGHVGAVFIENLVIDEEGSLLRVDRKCERAPVRDRARPGSTVQHQHTVVRLRAAS